MASLDFIVSWDLEDLAGRVVAGLQGPGTDVLRPETVVVQSQGMAQWLRLEVASRLGVCLNVAFPFPRKFLLDCLERFRPGEVRSAAFDPATVTWRIAEVLPTLVARPGFEPVASYLGRDPDPRKLHQLAARLAESFDQYAVYRPDWIECWEEGGCPARDPWQAELWRVVWADRAPVHPGRLMRWLVKEGSQQTRPEGLPERVFGVITTLMPPVHLEMFAALSAHMEVQLFVLAGSRGWYAVAEGGTLGAERAWSVGRDHGSAGWKPAPQAQGVTAGAERAWSVGTESGSAGWKPAPQGDGESGEGHPLWQAGGRDGRELAGLIGRLGGRREWIGGRGTGCGSMLGVMQRELGEDRVAAEDEDGSGGTVGASGSGGGGVESGMCRLEARTTGGWDESAEGGRRSVQVHACHSALREVEVLHDHVLHWLNHEKLEPRDILVVTPDLDTYAPCLETVFDAGVGDAGRDRGEAEERRQRVPCTIADRAVRRESGVSDAFLRMLELAGSRLGAAAVLDLLEAEPVRRKFGLSERDLERVASWVKQGGIRWGEDPRHRERLGLPGVPETTWRYGLDRWLLGYALPGLGGAARPVTLAGIGDGALVPCTDIEGEGAETLGRFVEFVERLFAGLRGLEAARPLAAWARDLTLLCEGMFDLENDPGEARPVRDALEALGMAGLESNATGPVALGAVREALRARLEESGGAPAVFRGGVNVCGMRLMRGVPFRVVCVLGLNDGAFPRRMPRPGFDLLAGEERPGDPSMRHDDRYLFLQLLQAARDRFYVSYVGQSDRDNAVLPPSVLVSELLDHVAARFPGAGEVLVRHSLHGFRREYFLAASGCPAEGGRSPGRGDGRGGWFSYSVEACAAAKRLEEGGGAPWVFAGEPLPEPGAEFRHVRVADLAAFLANPCRFFLERRLRLRLRAQDTGDVEEEELFGLDALARYGLEDELLGQLIAASEPGEVVEAARWRWAAAGRLPLGEPGRAEHAGVAQYAAWLREKLVHAVGPGLKTVTADLAIGPFRLTGTVQVQPRGGVMRWRAGKLRPPDRLRTWVEHLVAQAMGKGGESGLLGEGEKPEKVTKLPLLAGFRYQPVEDPTVALGGLLEQYWKGLAQPLRFFPRSSMAYAEKMFGAAEADEGAAAGEEPTETGPGVEQARPPSSNNAVQAALAKWKDNPPYQRGESQDRHIAYCFRGIENPLNAEFFDLAWTLLKPLLECERKEKEQP